jgi:hypothetical protein
MPSFVSFNAQTIHISSVTYNSIAIISLKPYTLAGFEPVSSVPEADTMSITPGTNLYQGQTINSRKIFSILFGDVPR